MRLSSWLRWFAVCGAVIACAAWLLHTRASQPMPWADVEMRVRDLFQLDDAAQARVVETMVRWPQRLDNPWCREVFGREVTEADLRELEQLVEPKNVMLRLLAEEYGRRLRIAIDVAREQAHYRRAQGSLSARDDAGDKSFYTATALCGGWAVALELAPSSHPELSQLRDELFSLRRERDFELAREIARRTSPQ